MTVYELIKRLAKYSPDSCGSEGIRIVFPGEDYTSPIVDEKEKD